MTIGANEFNRGSVHSSGGHITIRHGHRHHAVNDLDTSDSQRELKHSTVAFGATAGALAAACLFAALLIMPLVLGSFRHPYVLHWLPLVMIMAVIGGVICGITGGVVGTLGAPAERPILGCLVNASVFFVGEACCVALFVSSNEPSENSCSWLIDLSLVGGLAGTAGQFEGVAEIFTKAKGRADLLERTTSHCHACCDVLRVGGLSYAPIGRDRSPV